MPAVEQYLDELTEAERALMSVIYGHQLNDTGKCYAGRQYLADQMVVNERTIQRLLNGYVLRGIRQPGLIERGYVGATRRRRESNLLYLTKLGEAVVKMTRGKPVAKAGVRETALSPWGDSAVSSIPPLALSPRPVEETARETALSPNKVNTHKGGGAVSLTSAADDAPLFVKRREDYWLFASLVNGVDDEDRWVDAWRSRRFTHIDLQDERTYAIAEAGRIALSEVLWVDVHQGNEADQPLMRIQFTKTQILYRELKFWRLAP